MYLIKSIYSDCKFTQIYPNYDDIPFKKTIIADILTYREQESYLTNILKERCIFLHYFFVF